MSIHTDTMEAAAADAVTAPLDLLLTDAALGALRRVNPGGSGLRLAAALAVRPRLVARQGRQPGSPTTSVPGRAATGPPSCLAEASGSCCRRAGISPRW